MLLLDTARIVPPVSDSVHRPGLGLVVEVGHRVKFPATLIWEGTGRTAAEGEE